MLKKTFDDTDFTLRTEDDDDDDDDDVDEEVDGMLLNPGSTLEQSLQPALEGVDSTIPREKRPKKEKIPKDPLAPKAKRGRKKKERPDGEDGEAYDSENSETWGLRKKKNRKKTDDEAAYGSGGQKKKSPRPGGRWYQKQKELKLATLQAVEANNPAAPPPGAPASLSAPGVGIAPMTYPASTSV